MGEATNPGASQHRCKRPVAGGDVAPRSNVATQVDSSDDSGQGAMSCWTRWNEISLLLHRRGEPVACSTTVRHLFICRGAGSSSDDEVEHHEDIMPPQVDRESAAEDSPSQCVAVAAPSVVDGSQVVQVVSRGLKRLRIVQNNVEDVPPPAVLPPDEVPIPMVVALTDRSESEDALSDGSTTDTVLEEVLGRHVQECVENCVGRDCENDDEAGTRMEVVLDVSQDALTPTSRWGSDLQGEVVPTFPAIRGGHWIRLIEASEQCDDKAAVSRRRSRRSVHDDDLEKLLCHLGELSAGEFGHIGPVERSNAETTKASRTTATCRCLDDHSNSARRGAAADRTPPLVQRLAHIARVLPSR